MVIKQMKPLGFSLEEMAEILTIFATGEASAAPDTAQFEHLAPYLEQATRQRAKMARNAALGARAPVFTSCVPSL